MLRGLVLVLLAVVLSTANDVPCRGGVTGAAAIDPGIVHGRVASRLLLDDASRVTDGTGRRLLAELPVLRGNKAGVSRPDASDGGSVSVLAGVVVVCRAANGVVRLPGGPKAAGSAAGLDRALARLAVRSWAPFVGFPLAAAKPDGADDVVGGLLEQVAVVFHDPALSPWEASARWLALTDVVWAEPYYVPEVCRVPDDPRFLAQQHLTMIRCPEAWDTLADYDEGTAVAVVDGGIDVQHGDLAANVLLNDGERYDGLDNDGNGFIDDYRGWNFATGTDDAGALIQATPLSVLHGTHVAGIVSAATDNGLETAGVTWNSPVLCVAAGHPNEDNAVVFGFHGLLYAAERGARVINCSWGRSGPPSALETAVIDYLATLGILVCAAAGNAGADEPFYPAAYDDVLAVANVDDSGARSTDSNFGRWIQLAAPGESILSLLPDDGTGRLSGTSMASPSVAGCAAMVWTAAPWLTPNGVAGRLAITARNIAEQNPGFSGLLGAGLVDAAAAVTYDGPGYAVERVQIDTPLEPGLTVPLTLHLRNELADGAGSVDIQLTALNPGVEVGVGSVRVAALAAGENSVVPGFSLALADDLDPGSEIPLVWDLTWTWQGSDYGVRHRSRHLVSRAFVDLNEGEIRMSLAGNGRIGFAGIGGGTGDDGFGVRYVPGGQHDEPWPPTNHLFEGALLVATGPDRISDAARVAPDGAFAPDFIALDPTSTPQRLPALHLANGDSLAQAAASFHDGGAPDPLQVQVDWQALVPDLDRQLPAALVVVTLRNVGPGSLANLHYGFFLDWDLQPDGFLLPPVANSGYLAAGGSHAVITMANQPSGLHVATALVPMGNEAQRYRTIDNPRVGAPPGEWGVHDGFTDREKWDALSTASVVTDVSGSDVSQFWAAGPVSLARDAGLRFALVIVAGTSAAGIDQRIADASDLAREVMEQQLPGLPEYPFSVGLASPNPAAAGISLAVRGDPTSAWRLLVYDLRGRLVYRSDATYPGISGELHWDGSDIRGHAAPGGTYLLRADHAGQTLIRKVTLIR